MQSIFHSTNTKEQLNEIIGFIKLLQKENNYTKKPIHPKIYALFTVMFLAILLVMVLMNVLQARDDRRRRAGRSRG